MSRAEDTLGVDIDGTLANLWDWADEYIIEQTGSSSMPWNDYDHLRQVYGNEMAEQAFLHATHPERMMDRLLYDGAVEALTDLSRDMNIHFITHSSRGQRMRPGLEKWLSHLFDFEYKLTIVETLNKVRVLQRIGAFGIIDDKPETLAAVADAGLFAASLYHPYLLKTTMQDRRVKVFHHWSWAPFIVRNELIFRKQQTA